MVNTGVQTSRDVGANASETEPVKASAENANLPPQSPRLVPELNLQQQNLEYVEPVLEQVPTQLEMFKQLREMQSRLKSAEDALVDCKKELERRSDLKREVDGPSGPSKKRKGDKGKSKMDSRVRWCWKCRSKHLGDCSEATRRCGRCGEMGHILRDCRNEVKCFNCGENGHVSTACSRKREMPMKGGERAKNRIFWVSAREARADNSVINGMILIDFLLASVL